MTNRSFETEFANWKSRAERLDQQLKPIVHSEVDINAPDWEEQLASAPHPADESGLRPEIESLFEEIVTRFESCAPEQRQQIIDLMAQHDALMYSADIRADAKTPEGFRKHMILFVIEDQGKDTRDESSLFNTTVRKPRTMEST